MNSDLNSDAVNTASNLEQNNSSFTQRVESLQNLKSQLQKEIFAAEEEIKEINLSNQMEIASFKSILEAEESQTSTYEEGPSTEKKVKPTKSTFKINPSDIQEILQENFKLK